MEASSLVGRAVDGMVVDMDLGRPNDRSNLARLACLHARHRTPPLYERNQSRTNIALSKENGKEGAGQLAELLYVSLIWRWPRSGPRPNCTIPSTVCMSTC